MNIYCFSTLSFAKLQFKSVINKAFHKHGVASFTDAWIETSSVDSTTIFQPSHLLQMRGLKHHYSFHLPSFVLSHLLQMRGLKQNGMVCLEDIFEVASFTDAWIETWKKNKESGQLESHLLQMRGLKQSLLLQGQISFRRIFYRCVD